jgi:hypothetical protein
MNSSASAIQIICAVLGVFFLLFACATGAYAGGFLLGSIMFLFAALLGADHTANPSQKSRRTFQILAGIASLPILGVAANSAYDLAVEQQWGQFFIGTLQLLFFCVVVIGACFADTPAVSRILNKIGISTPNK